MPVIDKAKDKIMKLKYGSLILDVFVIVIFIVCIIELVSGSYNPFIYFRF